MPLNVNFPEAISKFESAMKERLLLKRILYKKILSGKGFEFEKYRQYTLSDDSSLIDWKASMRTGRELLIREYGEEEVMKVFFVIDVSDNMVFGSGEKIKNEFAAEIAASLSHLIVNSGDQIGFALFNDKVVKFMPISSGRNAYSSLATNLLDAKIYKGKSNLKDTLSFLLNYLKNVSSVFIISDFIKLDECNLRILRAFSERFETVGVMVRDSVDESLPDLNKEVVIEDPYTGEQMSINPGLVRYEYEKYAAEQKKKVIDIFKKTGSDLVELYTHQNFVSPLTFFLKQRIKRKIFIRK